MKKQPWLYQDGAVIMTVEPGFIFAGIYSEEQRKAIYDLIDKGYMPIKTVVGKARCTKKHWNLENYRNGFRMISSYPKSTNFNSITYFLPQ